LATCFINNYLFSNSVNKEKAEVGAINECMLLQMPGYGGYSGTGYGMMGGGWWMLFGWLFMILFWAAIILLIIWLYKQIRGPEVKPGTTGETATEILKKRYASGEITKEQYDEMKKELE
jgi:putative membrane protein